MKAKIFIIYIYWILMMMIIKSSLYSFNNKNQYIAHIKNCSSMEQIFKHDTIRLQLPEEYILGAITSVTLTKDGKLLIADERHLRLVLLFDKSGKFIKQIGNNGKGPGEYLTPRHVLTNNEGEIIISDPSLFRVSFYNSNGDFSHSFSARKMILGMAITSKDEILIHDQIDTKIKPGSTIFAYNKRGELLYQFGETSKAYQELKNIPYLQTGPFLTFSDDCIFEMDYPDYRVRKYCQNDKSKKEFGIKPSLWKSLLNTNYKKLPRPRMVDKETFAQLDNYFKNEFHKSTYIEWIHTLIPGILILRVHYNDTGDFTKNNYFIFYDTNGNLIKDGVKFNKFPRMSDYFFVYLLPIAPYGLCIAQYENTPEKMQNIQLIFLKPKCAFSKNKTSNNNQ